MGICFKAVKEEMLEMIMNWRMLPEVTQYMYTDPQLTLERQQEWFVKINMDTTAKYWVIDVDGTDIGLISLYDIDFRNKRCAWAYYIANTSFRGRGLAKSFECNIYNYVFDELMLNKLWCEVFCFNNSVVKLHQRFGSEIEGTLKQHIYKNGQFWDIVRMGITKNVWDEIKHSYEYELIDIE